MMMPPRNPLAARHLAVQGPGISVEQQIIRDQLAGSMAGANMPPAQAQATSGAVGQGLQAAQELNTQGLRAGRVVGDFQSDMAEAPQDYLQKRLNLTAAAELMPARDPNALVDWHKQRIIMAAEQATGKPAVIRGIA
jgi:hypothetical protein